MVELFSQIYPAFSWKDAEWLCGEWSGPKAIKVGILGTSCFWSLVLLEKLQEHLWKKGGGTF